MPCTPIPLADITLWYENLLSNGYAVGVISLKLPEEILEASRRCADTLHLSRSAYIRRALSYGIKNSNRSDELSEGKLESVRPLRCGSGCACVTLEACQTSLPISPRLPLNCCLRILARRQSRTPLKQHEVAGYSGWKFY